MKVRDARRERGWSQANLAARAGVSYKTIYRIESGGPVMPLVRKAVCEALGRDDIEIEVFDRVFYNAQKSK